MLSPLAQATENYKMIGTVLNIALYQSIWFLSVLGGNKGALAGLLLLVIHLAQSRCRVVDIKTMTLVLFIGLLIDGILQQIGFFTFKVPGFPIPFWLMVIWLGLGITLHHSLSWLKTKPLLSMVFGALGGPAAYWAGARLGASTFNWPLPTSLLVLAFIWALLFPAIMLWIVKIKK
jgi:hypothetical protein